MSDYPVIEVTEQMRKVAERIAVSTFEVSESEAKKLAQDDAFVQLAAADDLLGSARTNALTEQQVDDEIRSFTVSTCLDLSYIEHIKAEQILDREISISGGFDGGEADE